MSSGEEPGAAGGRGGSNAQGRLGKSGGRSSNSGGVAAAVAAYGDDKAAAAAYSLALARVRHETVQEGLRKKGHK